MDIYITLDDSAKGRESIDRVFSRYIDAENYVIDVLFANDERYSGRTPEFLSAAAKRRIVVRDVS